MGVPTLALVSASLHKKKIMDLLAYLAPAAPPSDDAARTAAGLMADGLVGMAREAVRAR